jgi:hypothetical protein
MHNVSSTIDFLLFLAGVVVVQDANIGIVWDGFIVSHIPF